MRPSTECPKCSHLIANNNFQKHLKACDGSGPLNHPQNRSYIEFPSVKDEKTETEKCECPICKAIFPKKSIKLHIFAAHSTKYRNGMLGKSAWNRGLTNETDLRVKRISEKAGKTNLGRKGKPLTEKQKSNLSIIMKERHSKGLAHNIGESRWNNQPSYPEQFFMRVIENEFEDKNYKREVPFHRFSLDFVWDHRKKVIEIDGDQHNQEAQLLRDQKKDQLLKEEGWQLLRIWWRDFYQNPKQWIEIAKEFVHS
jgi:very-short-patch-repair endonuclease